MFSSNQQFDEVRVYEQVAERTGVVVDRASLRRSKHVCSTMRELARKVRQLGDGTYYLPVSLWPEGEKEIPLTREWTTFS
jgi:hypothetical protein